MNENEITELIESVFNFDNIGDAMMACRANLDAVEPQQCMARDLLAAALAQASDKSPETVAALTKAAEARVQQYVSSSKKSKGTGCG